MMEKVDHLFCMKPGQENDVQVSFSKYEAQTGVWLRQQLRSSSYGSNGGGHVHGGLQVLGRENAGVEHSEFSF